MKNFIGGITSRSLLTLGWIALAISTWGYKKRGSTWAVVTIVVAVVAFLLI